LRILHVHSGNLHGGVESFLVSLARFRALAPSMDMSCALTSDAQIARELRREGVEVSVLGDARLSRPLSVWRARRALAAVVDRERPEVVVCHQAWPLVLFGRVAKAARVPVVLWVHMAANGHWLNRLAWRVGPDSVICNSHFTASTLPRIRTRVDVAYAPVATKSSATQNGVGCNFRGMPTEIAPDPISNEHNKTVIIQISRMEPLKGHGVLLDALGHLRDHLGWVCWMVGGAQRPHEEQYQASLRARAADLEIGDRVKFLGHRSDVHDLLRHADICCQPNVEADAFGLTLVEALAAGVPVVTSALGGALEIVDRSCGLLVPPRDAVALASQLERLIDDDATRKQLGANGPSRAKALCDPATQMPKIAEILRQAASRQKPRAAWGTGATQASGAERALGPREEE
jgi:glycosyltransferase involved in cell wall biosynthesis